MKRKKNRKENIKKEKPSQLLLPACTSSPLAYYCSMSKVSLFPSRLVNKGCRSASVQLSWLNHKRCVDLQGHTCTAKSSSISFLLLHLVFFSLLSLILLSILPPLPSLSPLSSLPPPYFALFVSNVDTSLLLYNTLHFILLILCSPFSPIFSLFLSHSFSFSTSFWYPFIYTHFTHSYIHTYLSHSLQHTTTHIYS